MKRAKLYILAVLMLTAASCQKEEITPSEPDLKPRTIGCNRCEGGWDLTDTIPANP